MTSGLSTAISMCTNVHPKGSTAIGPVDHPAGGGGLLLRLRNGRYVVSACGIIRTCPQDWARLIAEGSKP